MYVSPPTPKPPVTVNAPVLDEVDAVLFEIETAPVNTGCVVRFYADPLPLRIASLPVTPVSPGPPLVTGTNPVWFAAFK